MITNLKLQVSPPGIGVAPLVVLGSQKVSGAFGQAVGTKVGFGYLEAEEKVRVVRRHLLTAQSRQRSYANIRRRDLEFQIGDHVFLKVSPSKGIRRFGVRGKLSPRYIGPFEVLERVGPVAYRIALPPRLVGTHDVFHVSALRKYVFDPSHVINFTPLEIGEDLRYEERPLRILARETKELRNRDTHCSQVPTRPVWRPLRANATRTCPDTLQSCRQASAKIPGLYILPHYKKFRPRNSGIPQLGTSNSLAIQRDSQIWSAWKAQSTLHWPFEVLERVGPVAYRIALPPRLVGTHDVFHVSALRKYVFDPSHVINFTPLEIGEDLRYEERPLRILARETKELRNRVIPGRGGGGRGSLSVDHFSSDLIRAHAVADLAEIAGALPIASSSDEPTSSFRRLSFSHDNTPTSSPISDPTPTAPILRTPAPPAPAPAEEARDPSPPTTFPLTSSAATPSPTSRRSPAT
uniref:Tf2-1-like SH3-like domain-containing protein n=1 Tax=Ananas comosus var. bracteatus TaxID=296719 RepID=A0A6V7PGY5_ANACO|nr:unnamed protein product [Ananas comosus var. bracteatus]